MAMKKNQSEAKMNHIEIDGQAFNKEMNRRWEQGVPHDTRSEEILELLMQADVNDYFCWKRGGDGDNGETLMFQLDILFAQKDSDV